jgi:hypothetical protein
MQSELNYHVYNKSSFAPVPNKTNPIHNINHIPLKYILISLSHSLLDLTSDPFSFYCPNFLSSAAKALGSIHIILYDKITTRHDTTKTSVHSRLPSVKRWAKYSLLAIPTIPSLLLAVGDGLRWIRACENHKGIFCRLVLCRVVPYNVNRPLRGKCNKQTLKQTFYKKRPWGI